MTQVLTSATQTAKAIREILANADEIHFAFAWMTMSAPPLAAMAWLDKVECGVVGTSFARTDPEILELFYEHGVPVRVKENAEGIFHPKILIGLRGRTAWAFVGSSNFTAGGLRDNDEAGVVIRGSRTDQRIRALLAAIETWYDHDDSWVIDPKLIREYRAKHARLRRRPSATVLGSRSKPAKSRRTGLDIGWREFYEKVSRTKFVDDFTWEMRECQRYFDEHEDLETMRSEAPDALAFVAGFAGSAGFFGSTRPAREFKRLVKSDARRLKQLSKQLDKIPAKGEVDLRSAERVSRAVLDRFDGVGLGCWTRLLVVKRPDVFVAVNAGSRKRLSDYFGSSPNDVGSYFKLLQTVHEYPWYRAARPRGRQQGEIWHWRAALLDTIFYTPRDQ